METTSISIPLLGLTLNLGHVSITTTNIYAEVDLEMKAKALAACEIDGTQTKANEMA